MHNFRSIQAWERRIRNWHTHMPIGFNLSLQNSGAWTCCAMACHQKCRHEVTGDMSLVTMISKSSVCSTAGKLMPAKRTSTRWETLPTFNMQHLLIEIDSCQFQPNEKGHLEQSVTSPQTWIIESQNMTPINSFSRPIYLYVFCT